MYASWAMEFEHSSVGMIPEAPPQERVLMSTAEPHQRVCSALYAVARVSPGPCVDSLSGRVVPAVWLADQDHEIGRDDQGQQVDRSPVYSLALAVVPLDIGDMVPVGDGVGRPHRPAPIRPGFLS